MNQDKVSLLNDTLDGVFNIVLGFASIDYLGDFFAEKLMVIGTAVDEQYTSLAGVRKLIENQQEQSKGLDAHFSRLDVYRDFSADENVAIVVEEITIKFTVNSESTQFTVRSSAVFEFKNQQWKLIHWHASKPENVQNESDTFGIEEWKQKAEELEKLVAERTADLVKKNRELEIESSLERVRSRSMAMHQSHELAEAASVLFQQIKELGFEMWSCGFCIWKQNDFSELWMSADSGGLLPPMLMPYKEEPTHRKIYEASLRQESVHEYVWEGEELKEHYEFLYTIPSVKEAIDILKKSGLSLPARQCYYVGFFNQDYLLIITKEPTPEMQDLSYRFTRVFEQTYTRFLDLQKAEAQAELVRQNLILIQTEKQRAEDALTELKITQTQLIQKEKLASLGELTAGIAHEIQNPLNFVNNFSEVSTELVDELQEEQQKPDRDTDLEAELLVDLKQNLQKITHHGSRASAIVKGMLEHSRSSTGEKRPTDLNALADEYLKIAYHGLRRSGDPAKDRDGSTVRFNAELITDFGSGLGLIEVAPQEIGRVLLNLYNNAFYAVREKQMTAPADYRPTVTVSTRQVNGHVEIRVSDNGTGIPDSVKARIFQPFFTTKPTGEGTGLGLSLSYDIVTKGHGGSLTVESQAGEETTFVIKLAS